MENESLILPRKYFCLSELDPWVCQSLEFGECLGKALRTLHSKALTKRMEDFDLEKMTYKNQLELCTRLLKKHGDLYESLGLPLEMMGEILESYQGLSSEMEDTQSFVPIWGEPNLENIFLDEELNFSHVSFGAGVKKGPQGIDISVAWRIFEEPVLNSFFKSYGALSEREFERSLFCSISTAIQDLPKWQRNSNGSMKSWTVFSLQKVLGL